MKFESALLIHGLIGFLIGFLASYVAGQRNRNRTLWFILGLVFGWFALLFALFLPVKDEDETRPVEKEPEAVKTELPAPPQKEWFYLDTAHKQTGPVPRQKLQELWKEKALSEASYVWQEGMATWVRIRDLPELIASMD